MQQQKYSHTHISNNELVFLFAASWDEKKARPLSLLNTVAYNVYWNVCNYNTQYPQAPNVAAINLARLLTELLFFTLQTNVPLLVPLFVWRCFWWF